VIHIDGAQGEGGGQILRTSLSLSLVTGQPFRMENIRAGRAKPGLLRQHLTAVLAAAEVSGAAAEGAVLGSTAITFRPGAVKPGGYHFAVGTAGSATLVFQTVLPALMLAPAPSRVTLEGGTHNEAAPPYDFLAKTFLPVLRRMGPCIGVKFERYGFYPAGGGRFSAEVVPVEKLAPLELVERGALGAVTARAVVANLSRRIAQRELETAAGLLGLAPEACTIDQTRESSGPGNVVMVEVVCGGFTEVFTAFGKLGVTAERVATQAVDAAKAYIGSPGAADTHLADQLILPMALAGRGSFTAVELDGHARSGIDVVQQFLPVKFQVTAADGAVRVDCGA
jgi:RNA 3'-terminal phosphate cyclase (ATP)